MDSETLFNAIEISNKTNIPVLTHFWIVDYKDGTSIAQFDPITFEENRYYKAFGCVDNEEWAANYKPKKNDIIKIGWYPFNKKIVGKIQDKQIPAIVFSNVIKTVDIDLGDEPYLMRENRIKYSGDTIITHYIYKYKLGKNIGTDEQVLDEIIIEFN